MQFTEGVRALPLWINGRACLRLTAAFGDVRNPVSGALLRRAPLCGESDVNEAVCSALAALPAWRDAGRETRCHVLAAMADALSGLAEHFARIIAEETGVGEAQAAHRVAEIVAQLRNPVALAHSGVILVGGQAAPDVATLAGRAATALAAGCGVIVCPSLAAPSALLALAELAGRCGLPAGLMSVLYLDESVLAKLRSRRDPSFLAK